MYKEIKLDIGLTYSPPCSIVEQEELITLSAVVVVCGGNFCTFMSDGRGVSFNDQGEVSGIISDEYRKIIKLNNRVLFGATGKFNKRETITSPLDEYPDKSILTIPMVVKAVMRYLERGKHGLFQRNYLVGGKNNKGEFCVYEFQFRGGGESFAPVLYKPEGNLFVVRASVPNTPINPNVMIDKNFTATIPWDSHDELVGHMKNCVKDYMAIDPTVGGEIFVESIF